MRWKRIDMSTIPRHADHARMAFEQTTDDLFDMAERSAGYREALLVALVMLADAQQRLKLSRELYARLRDENRLLRASVMRRDAAA
jgi:hypothetical protein